MVVSRVGWLLVAVALAVVVGSCGGDDAEKAEPQLTTAPTSTAPASSAPASTTSVAKDCPNPEGGSLNTCLGDIAAGSYETTTLVPTLSYDVPKGWSNQEDLPGNFLLLPPGSTLAGVNPETSDFLGVYPSVAAAEPCIERVAVGVDRTPIAMVDEWRTRPAIDVGAVSEVTIGGLSGLQVDLSFDDARAGDACHDDLGAYALAIAGTGRSSLAHGVSPHYALRLALLNRGDAVLAIELADASGGSDYDDWWTAAAAVVDSFRFS